MSVASFLVEKLSLLARLVTRTCGCGLWPVAVGGERRASAGHDAATEIGSARAVVVGLRATLDQLQQQPAGAGGDGVGNAEETPSPLGLVVADVLLW